jgi:hypothetical protein
VLAPTLADPATGTLILKRGADTHMKPEVRWNLGGTARQILGNLVTVPQVPEDTCALPSVDAAAAMTAFVRAHPDVYGVPPLKVGFIKIGSARHVASRDGLCLVVAEQELDFPLARSQLSAIFERGGQLVMLTGDIDGDVEAPTGKTEFDEADCMASKLVVAAELMARGLDTVAREVSCGPRPATVRLGPGEYRRTVRVNVGTVSPFTATTETAETRTESFWFYVDPGALPGMVRIVDSERRTAAAAITEVTGNVKQYQTVDPDVYQTFSGNQLINVEYQIDSRLRGIDNWPIFQSTEPSQCPNCVYTKATDDTVNGNFIYDPTTPSYDAVTYFAHMQQLLDRLQSNAGLTPVPDTSGSGWSGPGPALFVVRVHGVGIDKSIGV